MDVMASHDTDFQSVGSSNIKLKIHFSDQIWESCFFVFIRDLDKYLYLKSCKSNLDNLRKSKTCGGMTLG